MKRRVALALAVVCLVAINAPAGAAPTWTLVGTAPGALYGHLAAVACPSPTNCFAVGTQDGATTSNRLIERWNGTKWSAMTSPVPPGTIRSQLSAVQCTAITSCFAVGQYTTVLVTNTLVEHWNGATWSIVPSPNPVGMVANDLSGVKCTSSTNCFAVGGAFNSTPDSSAELTLVEKWDGATWSIVPSPNPLGASDSQLSGITCTSSTSCFAVGSYDTEVITNTLIEQWDGATWSIVPSPNPGSSTFSELAGVTCTGPSNCFAVGAGHGTLAERWNGSSWSIVTTPNPTGATGVNFTSASCPNVARCFAVGDRFKGTVVARFVEMWNGQRWSTVTVPAPSGSKITNLSGVSCPTITFCFAVGDFRLGPSRRPLLIRYSG